MIVGEVRGFFLAVVLRPRDITVSAVLAVFVVFASSVGGAGCAQLDNQARRLLEATCRPRILHRIRFLLIASSLKKLFKDQQAIGVVGPLATGGTPFNACL